MKITGVLLAAGLSSRMEDGNKLLLPMDGQTMIEAVLGNMINSSLEEIIVITGHDSKRVEQALSGQARPGIRIVENKSFAEGRASSIACAMAALEPQCDAALFMVADKPTITSSLINEAISLFTSQQPDILAVKTPSGRGHPIVFNRTMFSELTKLKGDRIGLDLTDLNINNVCWLHVKKDQPNINTRQNYDHLMATMSEVTCDRSHS